MSGFIANASATSSSTFANAPFWPSIEPATVRKAMRFDGSVTEDRLLAALAAAVLAVNDDLQPWQQRQEAAGYTALADIPDVKVNGLARRMHLYVRAVACATAAELTERYRSYDAADGANQRADDLQPSIGELRRDQRWAISDLQGRPRSTVELI